MQTPLTDVMPLYLAAETVSDCATRVRTEWLSLGVIADAASWRGRAASAFRAALHTAVAQLGAQATELDAFAEEILQMAAAIQSASAVAH